MRRFGTPQANANPSRSGSFWYANAIRTIRTSERAVRRDDCRQLAQRQLRCIPEYRFVGDLGQQPFSGCRLLARREHRDAQRVRA
jgi:hypothetical protein